MREIKFRAWNKANHCMDSWEDISEVGEQGSTLCWVLAGSYITKDYELMQYTGLKDKNGKEIYEGDIITGPSDSRPIMGQSSKTNKRVIARFEVRWWDSDNGGGFGLKRLSPMERTYPHLTESEIIGNIYENPELLTK